MQQITPPPAHAPRVAASPWGSERLDLPAYLHRIGVPASRAADGAALATLHRAHLRAIPFENLDVILGRGISVDLDAVQDKLVDRARGGYCYEHATLFAAALEQVGFHVDRVLARTGDPAEHPRPRSHLVLLVTSPADGERWLADVGFGSGLLRPLALREDGPQQQGSWAYQLVRGREPRDTAWRLREHDGTGWTTIQTFTEEPCYLVDVEVANENTSTSPRSPFTQRPVVVLKDETRVHRLLGRQHTVEAPGQAPVQRELTDAEVAQVLHEALPDALTADEVAAVVASLPAESRPGPLAPGPPGAGRSAAGSTGGLT